MTVSVITACYNFENHLKNYLDSLINSVIHTKGSRCDFNIIFIDDDPEGKISIQEILYDYINELDTHVIDTHVIVNESNLGVTRSRNIGAKYIKDNLIDDTDWVIYFDVDDIWDIDAVKYLTSLGDSNDDLVFLPCDVDTIPINDSILGKVMELGEFCTHIPLQESIYAWRSDYFKFHLDTYGYLWYQDSSNSKYFPEDMVFYLNRLKKVFISDKVICHRTYINGNIAKDWKSTILRNKSAFKKLAEFHRINSQFYRYSPELVKYVEYLEYLTNDNRKDNLHI